MLKTKIDRVILCLTVTGLLLSGCSAAAEGKDIQTDAGNNEKEHLSDEIVLDDMSADSADIVVNVGTVTVGCGDTDTARIGIKYTVKDGDEASVKEILDIVKVKAEVKEDKLRVSVINKDTNGNIWSWIDRKYRNQHKPNLYVDLDVLLPAAVQDFDITCNVGDIKLHSLTGTFNVCSNVGSVEMKDINFTGDSKITEDVGDVTCVLNKDISEASEVSLETNIGNVKLDTNSLTYTVEGENKYNFLGTAKTLLVKELCKIKVNITLGEFNLR